MFKRDWSGALICGFLCIFFVFLSMGVASAACIGNPCVDEPGAGDILRSGSTSNIVVSIATDPFAFPITKYRLFYSCLGPDFQVEVSGDSIGDEDGICEPDEACTYNNSRWRLITTRRCNPYVGCPSTYPWSYVPYLPKIEDLSGTGDGDGFCEPLEDCTLARSCAIRVTALDNTGKGVSGIGEKFVILPPNVVPPFLYIKPFVITAQAGGSAKFEVFGKEPYQVDVAPVHQSYIAVNGSSSFPVSLSDPTPLTPLVLTVTNTYACGTSQEVTITVTDDTGATASALYVIACP